MRAARDRYEEGDRTYENGLEVIASAEVRGTKLYGAMADVVETDVAGIYHGYERRKLIPQQVLRGMPRMPNVQELSKTAPHTALALVVAAYRPRDDRTSREQQAIADLSESGSNTGVSVGRANELAGIFVNFLKATNPSKVQELDRQFAKLLWNFKATVGARDYEVWVAGYRDDPDAQVKMLLHRTPLTEFLLSSATRSGFEAFGIESPASSERNEFRRNLAVALR